MFANTFHLYTTYQPLHTSTQPCHLLSAAAASNLVRVQCEVGSQQAACVGVVVVVHLIHVV